MKTHAPNLPHLLGDLIRAALLHPFRLIATGRRRERSIAGGPQRSEDSPLVRRRASGRVLGNTLSGMVSPGTIFKRIDLLHITAALAELSHGDQTVYETNLPLTTEGNRQVRSSVLVRYLFAETDDADAWLLDLLDYMYFTSSSALRHLHSPTFENLDAKVLKPRGVALTDDGFKYLGHQPTPDTQRTTIEDFMHMPAQSQSPSPVSRDNKKVFVVHGRDTAPLHELEKFLSFVGLSVMTWTQARALTKKPQPTTYEIVRAGIEAAAAVIVIFSPDDDARLSPRFTTEGEEPEKPTGQPRQNVILEAGMAFASAPDRTIFVSSARVREISDISGFNYVKLDGTWGSREDLINRLRDAGAPAQPKESDLNHRLAGAFKVQNV